MVLLAIASGFEDEVLQQITAHTPSSIQKYPCGPMKIKNERLQTS
jgi:hypothetical protein